MHEISEVLDWKFERLELRGRSHDYLKKLYGQHTLVRELVTLPVTTLTAHIRASHKRPGPIVNDIKESLMNHGLELGTDPAKLPHSVHSNVRDLSKLAIATQAASVKQ